MQAWQGRENRPVRDFDLRATIIQVWLPAQQASSHLRHDNRLEEILSIMSKAKVSKNAFRRQQKKLKKDVCPTHQSECAQAVIDNVSQETPAPAEPAVSEPAVQAGDLPDGANDRPAPTDAALEVNALDIDEAYDFGHLPEFEKVFKRFQDDRQDAAPRQQEKEQVIWEEDNDNIPDEDAESAAPRKSKKQRKRENKLSVAELKAMAKKPELVEWTDADSSDPRLLLSIKSHRNVVPVPAHWSLKREVCTSHSKSSCHTMVY
jgi:splicing factor 3B subunit 2